MKNLALGVSLLLWTTHFQAAEPPKTVLEVYALGFADVDLVVEQVKGMISADGKVVFDKKNNRILVFDTPERQKSIKELIEKLQVPPRNIRIDVSIRDKITGKEVGFGTSASGTIVAPKVENSHGSVTVYAKERKMTSSHNSSQFITCLSGSRGYIDINQEVPYVDWFFEYELRCGYLQANLAWKKVGARLAVQPNLVGNGNYIHVALTPEFSYFVGSDSFTTAYDKASTEVTVANGQDFQIGGGQQQQDFYSRFLVGFDSSHQTRRLDITLRPTILETK